jgi:hypothetical protein
MTPILFSPRPYTARGSPLHRGTGRVLSLAFALRQLAIHLADLAECITERAAVPSAADSSAEPRPLTEGEKTS